MRILTRLLVVTSLIPTLAVAQQQTQVPPDSVVFKMPPITVSGTRSATSVYSTPLGISVVGPSALDNTRGYGLDEALKFVPGVLAQSRFGNNDVRITIRGFGARGAGDRSNAGTSRGIRVLVDGIPETEPDGRTAFDFIDLTSAQSIEVVRSNASPIWGNAGGGVISISTVPGMDEPKLSLQQMGGTFGLMRSIVEGTSQFGTGIGYFNFSSSSFDGWRQNSDSRRALLTLGLVTPLGDKTNLSIHAAGADNHFSIPGPLTQTQVDADPSQANATYLARRERRWNRLARLGVSVEHSFDDATDLSGSFFINPKYLQRSERNTYRDFTRYHGGASLLLRRSMEFSSDVHNSLMIGADEALQDGAILFYNLTAAGERGSTVTTNKREGANNFGFFIRDEIRFGENVSVAVGVRRQDISYYSDNFLNPTVNASKVFRKWIPLAAVSYMFTPTHSIYANLGGGIEAPAGNETDPIPPEDAVTTLNTLLEPIQSTTIEVGTKHGFSFDQGALAGINFDVAVYNTKVVDEIIPYNSGRFYVSAGEVRRRGVEIGARARARFGLGLTAAFTMSDNDYIDYVIDSTFLGSPGAEADFSGNEAAGVPSSFYGVGVDYTFAGSVKAELSMQGVSKFFADDANTVNVPAYNTLGATLSLARPIALGSKIGLSGFVAVNNLTDKSYIASAFTNPDLVSGERAAYEPGLPRNVVVSLSLKWLR